MQPLNIQIFVDVIALLADQPNEATVFAYDDSSLGSQGKGTRHLHSAVWPGQLVRWSLVPIDVQTHIWIDQIVFGLESGPAGTATAPSASETPAAGTPATGGEEEKSPPQSETRAGATAAECAAVPEAAPVFWPWQKDWQGYVPWCLPPGIAQPYRLHLRCNADGRAVVVDGPALVFTLPPPPCAVAEPIAAGAAPSEAATQESTSIPA